MKKILLFMVVTTMISCQKEAPENNSKKAKFLRIDAVYIDSTVKSSKVVSIGH